MATAVDVLTLTEARTALSQGASYTGDDTTIAAWVTAISLRLDAPDGVGPIVRRTISAEKVDGAGTGVQLKHWPVYSVTSVTEDNTTLTASDYLIDEDTGILWRQSGSNDYPWCEGRNNIEVTYIAGRFAATANVDEFYKRGAVLLLRHMWRSEQWNAQGLTNSDYDVPQVAFPGFGIPNAVKEWFGATWRGKKGGFS